MFIQTAIVYGISICLKLMYIYFRNLSWQENASGGCDTRWDFFDGSIGLGTEVNERALVVGMGN